MKNKLLIALAALLFLGVIPYNQGMADTHKKDKIEDKHTDFYDAFLALLNPYAEEAIRKKYPKRSYALWDAEIVKVKRVTTGYSEYDFIVIVKYDTYTVPLNSPEGFVTLTFHIKTDHVSVIDIKE